MIKKLLLCAGVLSWLLPFLKGGIAWTGAPPSDSILFIAGAIFLSAAALVFTLERRKS